MPFCCFKAFLEKFIEKFSFRHKMTISKRALKYSESLLFLPCLKGKNCEENLDLFKLLFLIKPVKGDKFQQKMFFSTKWATYSKLCHSVVLSIFVEIHRELFFLDIKVAISETSTEKLRKFVFLTIFERGKSWGKVGFD